MFIVAADIKAAGGIESTFVNKVTGNPKTVRKALCRLMLANYSDQCFCQLNK
jgi:hypothetical protein